MQGGLNEMEKIEYTMELSIDETDSTIMDQIRCPKDKVRLIRMAIHRDNILTGPQCEFYLKCPECESIYSIDIALNQALLDIDVKVSIGVS